MSASFHRVCVPISVPVAKNKKFYLNLNQYRNAHHFTLSKAKVNFHEIVAPRIRHLPHFDQITLIYTLFTGTEQLVDTPNVCSIVDKFFSDVLVTCKKIEDDNRKIVLGTFYRYGGVDRSDPRVEVTIVPGELAFGPGQQEKEEPMQITIAQVEIEQAIRDYINKQINVRDDHRIDIDLKATRGPEGYQAVIDIVPNETPASDNLSTGLKETAAEVKAERAAEPAKAPAAPAAPAAKAERPKAVTKGAASATLVPTPKAADPKLDPVPEPAVEAKAKVELVDDEEQPKQSIFDKVKATADAADAANTAATAEPAAEPAVPVNTGEEPPKRPSLFAGLGAPQNG